MFQSIEANIFVASKQTDKDAWLTTLQPDSVGNTYKTSSPGCTIGTTTITTYA